MYVHLSVVTPPFLSAFAPSLNGPDRLPVRSLFPSKTQQERQGLLDPLSKRAISHSSAKPCSTSHLVSATRPVELPFPRPTRPIWSNPGSTNHNEEILGDKVPPPYIKRKK